MAAAVLVEIPIGNAVDGGNDARVRTQRGLHPIDDAGDGMGLEADDQVVLLAEFSRIVGAARVHDAFLAADQQLQSILPHGGEVRAARDQTDVGARTHKFNSEITTDCTSAVNADLHDLLATDVKNRRERPPVRAALSGSGSQIEVQAACAALAAVQSSAEVISCMLMTPTRL